MSESEVSQIRDEDVLRRMWQQTEDFSRKKEIRAHMYRLREERLRNLYSPEPAAGGKGCEFTSEQGHVKSFADQNFQSMKSKEVRDAGSPPKEFTYRGQDLKELSNAGWNVESEDRTTDDGRTHVKSVNANIEGRYDVEGGRGQFAAVDHQRQATTEYCDDNSSLRRDETSSDTAAHEHVVRQTDDGTRVSSTTSSSNTSSKFQQVSSTKHETVPYLAEDDYDIMRRTAHDTNRNEQVTRVTNRNDYEQTLRKSDFADAELVSRKIEYPDDHTKVIVETRCLPDGTRVTSTRREFRAPAQTTGSEYQTRSDSKSYSSQHKSDTKNTTSKITRHTIDNRSDDIVDSQRNVDDNDFKRQIRQYTVKDNDTTQQHFVTKTDGKVTDYTQTEDDFNQKSYETRVNNKIIDHSTTNRGDLTKTQHRVIDHQTDHDVDETDRRHVTTTRDHDIQQKVVKESRLINEKDDSTYNIIRDHKNIEEKSHHFSRDKTATEKRVHDVLLDRSVPEEGARHIPQDKTVPNETRYIPKDVTVPQERFRDMPRDRVLPEDKTSHSPRDRTIPVEKTYKLPTDGTVPMQKIYDISTDRTNTDERVHNITRETKVEEVIDRKSSNDHYQTTYQNDFQSRKISNDLSPTHQAWASTLRSDTPTTTRPSTRASSPGSKTFKSSTSSLRSSVSPDKSSRKPSSRGDSPNKLDRYSPTRTVTSDRYSSTHSTNSVTEIRTKKTTSPERKPPTGRSSARPEYSPDRKPQDARHRPSASPEKIPQKFTDKPSSNPERKPTQKSFTPEERTRTTSPLGKRESPRSPVRPTQSPEKTPTHQSSDVNPIDTYSRTSANRSPSSPERKPIDDNRNRSPLRSSPSSDRKFGYENPTDYPKTSSPSRPHYPVHNVPQKSVTSPDRKPDYGQPSRQSPDKPVDKHSQDLLVKRPSVSPDRKPSYMRPTEASQFDDKTRKPSQQRDAPDRKSPTKHKPTQSPDRKPKDFKDTKKITEDHYRFVDEETKVYTRIDKTDTGKKTTTISTDDYRAQDESLSLPNKMPSKPTPQKDIIKTTENDEIYIRLDKTVETSNSNTTVKQTEDITAIKRTPKNKEDTEGKNVTSRETSPSKYGTYDKKKPREDIKTTEVTTITTEDNTSKDVKYDSLTRRGKTLSENQIQTNTPSSPKKKTPKESTSPVKVPTKDMKYKNTTDFLATEIASEEISKKTTMKDRPRQLVTPSSSPTRKPKATETEPSTGQSSPTTSVSGFVYFGSPCTEKPMVTDLDEVYPDSEETTIRPQTLNVQRSPSPSKIPCRSPSPEKYVPTTKDSLPRKSSLKKPSTDVNKTSPMEKPPTSFCVSPTVDKPNTLDHNVIKKDYPSEPETGEPETGERDTAVKPKPPLHRRETYEDRCKKILGMGNDTTTETVTKEIKRYPNKTDSSQSSPSVSPCDSPTTKESPSFSDYPTVRKTTSKKDDVTDFISHEQEEHFKTSTTRDNRQSGIPSRESSPTKLQNIVTTTTLNRNTQHDNMEENLISKTIKPKYPSPTQSPKLGHPAPGDMLQKSQSKSPERIPSAILSNPSKRTDNSPRLNMSPERKSVQKYQKDTSPLRTSPERVSGSIKTTVSSKYDATTIKDDIQETTKITKKIPEKSKPTRVLKSPTRETPKPDRFEQSTHPHTSPFRPELKDGSYVRETISPNRALKDTNTSSSYVKYDDILHSDETTRSRSQTPEKIPGYMKSTTANIYKYETTLTTDRVDKKLTIKNQESKEPQNKSPSSPTRQTPHDSLRAGSPMKTSQPDSSPQRKPAKDAPAKNPNDQEPTISHSKKPHEVPGYMKTTTAATTKIDTTLNSENIKDTTKTKTVEKKHTSLGRSNSPTRKPKSFQEHRTPSPTKTTRPSDISPDRKSSNIQKSSSPIKEITTKNTGTDNPMTLSPTQPGSEKVPRYMESTASATLKHETFEYDSTTTENKQHQTTITSKTIEQEYPVSRKSKSPTRQIPKSTDEFTPKHLRTSPCTMTKHESPERHGLFPDRKLDYQHPKHDGLAGKPIDKNIKELSPTCSEKTSDCMITKTAIITKFNTSSTVDDTEESISYKNVHKISEVTPQENLKTEHIPPTFPPSKQTDKSPRASATSPDRKTSPKTPVNNSTLPVSKDPKDTTPGRSSVSPERHGYMKPTASIISKYDTANIYKNTEEIGVSNIIEGKNPLPRSTVSPDRQSPEREPKENPSYLLKPEEPRQLRTPSPTKNTTKVVESNNDFIMSEREQEILNKVQKSLRKLSPERKERSPSRERSPTKTSTSLQDLDIITTEINQNEKQIIENLKEIVEEQTTVTSTVMRPRQPKETNLNEQKAPSKPSSRNVSPIKRTPLIPATNKVDKSPESPTKSRSISPKKPVSYADRPHSPQVPKVSGIKPREHIPPHLTRKQTPATLSTTKIERLTTDVKKSNGVTNQSIFTKAITSKATNRSVLSSTNKNSDPEPKRAPTPKGVKENISPKKDGVTRTFSDIGIKANKTSSPQRMKSKPEIQVSDMSTKSPKSQKSTNKQTHSKLPSKSATALNTSTDEDHIIIDVQQSKSSRENSPDRICPTPVNFSDDVGIPRFPDEVSEPDDDLVKRSYHTIHETESVVDDIVEICEDEELFVKKSNINDTEHDDSLLSVTDKVNQFSTKIYSVTKPQDIVTSFKDTEQKNHSDFVDENLKSDECLLTVSEKVNKFAKGPRDTKDSRSPSRKITDEYDKNTVYQDDYTKLSVNDKAHLFVETAENVKVSKVKPAQKVERPDFSHIDESLKSDDCLLSVSDKVNKFVKTAEQYLTDSQVIEETENKIKEQHEKIMRQIVDSDEETLEPQKIINAEETDIIVDNSISRPEGKSKFSAKEPKTPQPIVKDYASPNSKIAERIPAVKITTLRSSEAVKKAKALFENIASTQKDATHSAKTTKLTDIGVIKKSPKSDSTIVLHPSVEDVSPQVTDVDSEVDAVPSAKDRTSSSTHPKPQYPCVDEKPRNSPNRLTAQTPEGRRSKSPMRQSFEVNTKTVLSRYPAVTRAESPRQRPESPRQRTESPRQRPESDKPDKLPGYLRPTKTSQIKEEPKIVEDTEVSSRRGSGKFGVELRRTSIERSTISSERRRSVEHHQPCIEDIFDLDLLEQMLEKVMGYEQRRRIRAQIRVAKTQSDHVRDTHTYSKTNKQITASNNRSPERKTASSPEAVPKTGSLKTSSPDRYNKTTLHKSNPDRNQQSKEPTVNGLTKETTTTTRQRPHSPEKTSPKSTLAPKTPIRQPSPEKRRTTSPTKAAPKPKGNRFNEYASAYMKKVGLNESDKIDKMKFTDNKTKKSTDTKQTVKHERQQETVQEFTTTKSFSERTSSKDIIEIVQTNGKRSPSPEQRQTPERKVQFPQHSTQMYERKAQFPEQTTPSYDRKAQSPERKAQSPVRKAQSPDRKRQSPERRTYSPEQKAQSPERLQQRTPSPDFKRPKSNKVKETVVKTLYDIDKKLPSKPVQEDKPSWVTNRNLKKITSETRTYSSKKIENEKPKYRAPSPSKVITKPIDVITSSYGPGPLDADGKPLFGIKALRNGASNFQVKGTVIRQEFHSRNGGEPEGTVSVTAYSTQPEELEQLLASQGGEPPSRIHGLAAITTTKKFGGDTGNTLSNVHTKEDRASLEQFTHHDRRVESLESRTYDTRSEEFSEDTQREEILGTTRRNEISGSTKRIESRKDGHTDRNNRSTRREEKVTEVKKGQKVEEKREKVEKREDKMTVRQSSVKSLTEKYIKSANDSGKTDRSTYPKAGLILRTTTMRDSVSSDDALPGLVRTDSEHSLGSVDDSVVTTTERTGDGVRTTTTRTTHHHGPTVTTHTRGSTIITHHEPVITTKKTSTVITQEPVITHRVITQEPVVTHRVVSHEPVLQKVTRGHGSTTMTERSFLDSNTKVTGVQDILSRMKNADIVIQEGDTTEDSEARALLNKFLGATVLMAGMQGYVNEQPTGKLLLKQETVRSSSDGGTVSSRTVEELDLDQCWDERLLKKLLDDCTDYEQRRRLRARIRTLMAEQEACASAVTEALGVAGADSGDGSEAREEEEITVTSSVRRDSSDKTVSSSTTTKTSKVIEMTRPAPKPVSPFAKFRQLEKQNSTNSPNSPKTPQSPGSPSQPYFKFTDPALQCSALTIKERLLQWCRDKTRDYENVKLENFSTSWADGLAFCALVHHFLPDAFDYSKLTADKRRHNFTLAFKVADEKAGIYPLLDVDDMVAMRKPDWKCVFTYVQAIYRRFKDEQ